MGIQSENVKSLPRGGYLLKTDIGHIQFGSPPETIKDTMLMPCGVPNVFVLPKHLFNWLKGISIGELEFPIYYNFFLRNKKTIIICRASQKEQMIKILREALFGPKNLNISRDYYNSFRGVKVPNLRNEMNFFRNNLKFSDLFAFGIFKNNKFTYKGITIKSEADIFSIFQNDELFAVVPDEVEYKASYKIGQRLQDPFTPPLFGVTCLGPSHGFDPEENTSGFIIWLNHSGIMVDPPVNSTEWLTDSNVNPKFIDSIILTHCHADHDAGTFQKILEEGKITVYSTETIMMSFLRKYSALSDVPISYLLKLFDFHPVKIGRPVFINNGAFHMFYTLHSIPTIGFRMEFQDQSFVYSSDHNSDPEVHKKLLEKSLITQERHDEFTNFPWKLKVIYHESGIAPLHTPIQFLNSLPDDIQKRTVVYHIAKKDFPEKTSLTLATFGIENTLYFETSPPEFEQANKIISIIKQLDFYQDINVEKVEEFLNIVQEEKYSKGEYIIQKGSIGDRFYIIYSGNALVDSEGLKERKIYSTYDYFGEVALITGEKRNANIIAETDVLAFTIKKDQFLNFIVGTEFEKTLQRLVTVRTSETWNLLSKSKFFHNCTSTQKTWLESLFIAIEKEGPGVLLAEGKLIGYVYIIRDGEVKVSKKGEEIATLIRGDFVGTMQDVHTNVPSGYNFSFEKKISLFAIKAEDILVFVDRNPGLLMKLVYHFED
jgi:CRP-like cAMP-binding protein/phosphoribosyl 1,2-cyclic phosphodiesterase